MDWTELVIQVKIEDLETASAIAQMVVPYGIYVEDYSHLEEETWEIAHIQLIDEQLLEKDRSVGWIHLYFGLEANPVEASQYLQACLEKEGIWFELRQNTLRQEDWENHWKQYFKPLEVGKRLLICPSWEEAENAQGRHVLSIDPGAAFGTGTHATTQLCMELLEDYVTPDTQLLDIGTGSGILSIAALLLGAKEALGVDIDGVAVRTARENGAVNGFLPPRYEMRQGNLTQEVTGRFSVITANIVADVILSLLEDVPRFLTEDGVFLMSGIIDLRLKEVLTALEARGYEVKNCLVREGWVALAAACGGEHSE